MLSATINKIHIMYISKMLFVLFSLFRQKIPNTYVCCCYAIHFHKVESLAFILKFQRVGKAHAQSNVRINIVFLLMNWMALLSTHCDCKFNWVRFASPAQPKSVGKWRKWRTRNSSTTKRNKSTYIL